MFCLKCDPICLYRGVSLSRSTGMRMAKLELLDANHYTPSWWRRQNHPLKNANWIYQIVTKLDLLTRPIIDYDSRQEQQSEGGISVW